MSKNCQRSHTGTRAMDERADRITRLIEDRGMTPKAAATVVDAAMFGIGCIEGQVRKKIQEEIDAKANR